MIRLSKLLESSGVKPEAFEGDADISTLVADSRKAVGGSLFVCMPSDNSDTKRFIAPAIASGASAVVVHDRAGFDIARSSGVAAIHFSDFLHNLSFLCKAYFENPSAKMRIIGITGTNGKTTTAWILRDALESLGRKPAYLGTLGLRLPSGSREMANTTPFPVELYETLSAAAEEGVTDFIMEVSSHALDQGRAEGLEFDAALFTNLSQDHLDFHGSMEAYEESKKRLFTDFPAASAKPFVGVLNVDDPVGSQWSEDLTVPVVTFGLGKGMVSGEALLVEVDNLTLEISYRTEKSTFNAKLGGHYNVQNCLGAAALLIGLGYSLDDTASALATATPVPGRFEPVQNGAGIGVLVDYAHTPDALEKLLDAVQALPHRRIITVFGCGGDRDKAKRPLMARSASSRSDLSVVTSDNPRTEDPAAIIQDVVAGLAPGTESVTIVDRREAVAYAIEQAQTGDIVVIAGKGHEDYQIIGREKIQMDDRELAREALAKR